MEAEAPKKPIEIHMGSYGGDTYHMLRLHDTILASTCQFKFFGSGPIMSSGSLIMACCDERFLYPNATVMVHEVTYNSEFGKNTDGQINALEVKRLMDIVVDIYVNNSRMPKEFWEEMLQRDLHMSASEAVSLGLADKLIEPKKRGNLRKLRQAALKKDPSQKEFKSMISDMYKRIGRSKHPKIEFNEIKKELTDPEIVVDNTKSSDLALVLSEPNKEKGKDNEPNGNADS
jgi:ATP-dependent protease ClpP protease subunit